MLKKRGKYWYGDSRTDIQAEILRYSKLNGYQAHHFADAICTCSGTTFQLSLDDNEGAAVRRCSSCGALHSIADSGEYLEDAELEECGCPCDNEDFEIAVGVSLFEGSNDVRWLYLGCRCPKCGITAVYGDWKNEYSGYESLLQKV